MRGQNIHSLMRTHSFVVRSSKATPLTFGFSKLPFIMIGFFFWSKVFFVSFSGWQISRKGGEATIIVIVWQTKLLVSVYLPLHYGSSFTTLAPRRAARTYPPLIWARPCDSLWPKEWVCSLVALPLPWKEPGGPDCPAAPGE